MRTFWIACTVAMVGTAAFLWKGGDILTMGNRTAPPPEDSSPTSNRTIFAGGVVEGDRREVALNFEISGRLATVEVREGERIRQRQILAQLDDTVLQQELAQAKSRLALAKAERERLVNGASKEQRKTIQTAVDLAAVEVERAELDAKRALEAFRKDAITRERLDDYRYRLKTAVAELKRARAKVAEVESSARSDDLKIADARIQLAETAIEQSRTMIAKTRILAPTDGVVLNVDIEPGERVTAMHASPAITIVDDSRILIRAFVEELDAITLAAGQPTYVVADGLPDRRFKGTITWIAPSMQPKNHRHNRPGERLDTRVREVLIRINQPKGLVIGLPVDVYIEPPRR